MEKCTWNSDVLFRYGDIFSFELGPFQSIVVNELSIMKEMCNQDVFNGRNDPKLTLGHKIDAEHELRGGHGHHGIIGNWGWEWKEQRRFALR